MVEERKEMVRYKKDRETNRERVRQNAIQTQIQAEGRRVIETDGD